MTLTNSFSRYPHIQVVCQDRTVSVVISPGAPIPTLFNSIIFSMCNEIAEGKQYKSLTIELKFPTGGVPIGRLYPKERNFSVVTEATKIKATTYFDS